MHLPQLMQLKCTANLQMNVKILQWSCHIWRETDCESGPAVAWPSLAQCEGDTGQSGAGLGPLEAAQPPQSQHSHTHSLPAHDLQYLLVANAQLWIRPHHLCKVSCSLVWGRDWNGLQPKLHTGHLLQGREALCLHSSTVHYHHSPRLTLGVEPRQASYHETVTHFTLARSVILVLVAVLSVVCSPVR